MWALGAELESPQLATNWTCWATSRALSILCLKRHIRFLHTFFDKEEIVSTPCEIGELNSLYTPNDEGNEVETKLALSEIIERESSYPFLLTD